MMIFKLFTRTDRVRFDDIDENSPLRRGKATTHPVFGIAQTMNSAEVQAANSDRVVVRLHSKATRWWSKDEKVSANFANV
jgi:geranylgeranyl pyrophosphate synthase